MSGKDLDAGEQKLPKLPKRYARSMDVTRDPHAVHERYADLRALACKGWLCWHDNTCPLPGAPSPPSFLEDAGQAFSEYQDRTLMNVPCKRIQVDEAWAFKCFSKKAASFWPALTIFEPGFYLKTNEFTGTGRAPARLPHVTEP
jgi:hypothetical protein